MEKLEDIIEHADFFVCLAETLLCKFEENYIDTIDARRNLAFDLENRLDLVIYNINAIFYFICEAKRWLEAYTDPTGQAVSSFFLEADTIKQIVEARGKR